MHLIGRSTGGPADPYGEWEQRREVGCDGCVLVRPDRHVAWRYPSFDASAADALRAALEQVLAVGPSTVLAQSSSATDSWDSSFVGADGRARPSLGVLQSVLRTIARAKH